MSDPPLPGRKINRHQLRRTRAFYVGDLCRRSDKVDVALWFVLVVLRLLDLCRLFLKDGELDALALGERNLVTTAV